MAISVTRNRSVALLPTRSRSAFPALASTSAAGTWLSVSIRHLTRSRTGLAQSSRNVGFMVWNQETNTKSSPSTVAPSHRVDRRLLSRRLSGSTAGRLGVDRRSGLQPPCRPRRLLAQRSTGQSTGPPLGFPRLDRHRRPGQLPRLPGRAHAFRRSRREHGRAGRALSV